MLLYDLYNYLTNLQSWHVLALLLVVYTVYYLIEVVKRPIFAVDNGPFKKFLLNNVPMVQSKFWPTFWCAESRAQTIFASLLREYLMPDINYRREMLTLKDGGEIALDWSEKNCTDASPLILILPGLTGASQSEYINCFVTAASNIGARVVVFNYRGMGGVALKTPRLYSAANVEDLSEVVAHISKAYPNTKIGATGISMGGLLLGNYLALHNDVAQKVFTACQIISVPLDAPNGALNLEKPFLNVLIDKHLTVLLRESLSQHDILDKSRDDIDFNRILKSRTIKEFDRNFTSKHFGYKDVDHYYNAASLHNKLYRIKVPLLCLNAADDPFQPFELIPLKAVEESSHVAIVVTARGGHIGFMEGFLPKTNDEYMARFFTQYYKSTLFNDEFKQVTEEMMKTYPRAPFYQEQAVFGGI